LTHTVYFSCILISRFWSVEISLHFNLAFSQGAFCKVNVPSDFSHVHYRLTRLLVGLRQ